ncbi:hypothetical protein IWW48_001592 [Coemansia sp. RSA 1200]|nr:hypothetical protein IWW48_001592 [Coemansia sp. RSA 1200]
MDDSTKVAQNEPGNDKVNPVNKPKPDAAVLRAAALSSLRAKIVPMKKSAGSSADKDKDGDTTALIGEQDTAPLASPSICSTVVQNTPLPRTSILDISGRYGPEIRGELVPVNNKHIYSSSAFNPPGEGDNHNEDFESLLEQYVDQSESNDARQGYSKPDYGDMAGSKVPIPDGEVLNPPDRHTAAPNPYGLMDEKHNVPNTSQIWMQAPQYQYYNQIDHMVDMNPRHQGFFSGLFGRHSNNLGQSPHNGYNSPRQMADLLRNPLSSKAYSRETRQQSLQPVNTAKRTIDISNQKSEEHDSAQAISEGELVSDHEEDESMSLSEGEVYDQPEKPMPLQHVKADGIPGTSIGLDVVSIVKERIAQILKNRDPKLLQSPRLRALMLLLKCIRLDDPDDIYMQVKSASFQVLAELNSLSAEFGLGMITDACMNTLLVTRSIDDALNVTRDNLPDKVSRGEDIDSRSYSEDSESSRGVDMDTSSDIGFDDIPQLIDQSPELVSISDLPTSTDTLDLLPQVQPPTTPARFSRSRAPSPPSVQPKTPRALLSTGWPPSPQIPGVDSFPAKIDIGSPLTPYKSTQSALSTWESTLCSSESGRLVVFVSSDNESSSSESISNSAREYEGDEEDSSSQRSKIVKSEDWFSINARKRGIRMLNRECRRLAREEQQQQQSISRSQSFNNLSRQDTIGHSPWLVANQPMSRVALQSPNNALHNAKMSLKAHEEAIAKLKLQISRKQAAALMRKRIHVSNVQRSLEATAIAASEPLTPRTDADVEDSTACFDAQPHVQQSYQSGDTSQTLPLPNASDFETLLQQVSPSRRSSILRDVDVTLCETMLLKQAMLELLKTEKPENNDNRLESGRFLSDIVPRLDRRQKALEDQKGNLNGLIYELQARLKLADIQLDIIEHGRRISDALKTESKAFSTLPSESSSHSILEEKRVRSNILQDDIRAIQTLRRLFVPEPDQKPAAIKSASDDVYDQQTNPDVYQRHASNATTNRPIKQGDVTASIDNARKRRHMDELRAKMDIVQKEQKGLSRKLETLASKGGKPLEHTPKALDKDDVLLDSDQTTSTVKRQKVDNAGLINGDASPKTKIRLLFAAAAASVNESKVIEDQQRIYAELNTSTLDNCILQPLIVADGIGMPALANPTTGFLSRMAMESQRHHDSTSHTYSSRPVISDTLSKKEAHPLAADYVAYESPFGSADVSQAIDHVPDDPTELYNVSTAELLEAMHLTPPPHAASAKQFYSEIDTALREVCGNSTSLKISNKAVALALLPIWKSHVRSLVQGSMSKENPLYAAIGFDSLDLTTSNLSSHDSYQHASIVRNKVKKRLRYTFKKHARYLPVLNRDLAFYPSHSDKSSGSSNTAADTALSGRNVRYFDIGLDADDHDSESERSCGNSDVNDNVDDDLNDDLNDELDEDEADILSSRLSADGPGDMALDVNDSTYSKALRWLWKDSSKKSGGNFNVSLYPSLYTKTNKRVSKSMLYLKKALQASPSSEKLWDLYLELYSRQDVPDSEVVSAFSDATKFLPHSISIWRRYARWCGWNTLRNIGSNAESTAWQGCLSMVTSMAIKCLSGDGQGVHSEEMSATIAELVVHFWDCSWAAFEGLSKPGPDNKDSPKPAVQFKSRLVAHMHACLAASSTRILCDEISDLSISNVSTPRSKVTGSAWKSTEWILGRLLLPHHLLFVGQVFLCCFIEATFVPHSVLERMYAALYEGLRCQSAYYLCLDNIAEKSTSADASANKGYKLQPYIMSVVRKMFGGIKDVLLSYGDEKSDVHLQQDESLRRAIQQSCGLCSASMRVTLVQLKQYLLAPAEDAKSVGDCEDLLQIINRGPAEALFDSKDNLLSAVIEQGTEAPLLITYLLCADNSDTSESKLKDAICVLHEHSVLAARSMDIDTVSFNTLFQSRVCDVTLNRETIAQCISEARQLYYRLVGYTGVFGPKTERSLVYNFLGDLNDTRLSEPRQKFCRRAGTWSNLALIEVLYSVFESDRNFVSRSAIDSAFLWIHHGLKQLSSDNVGGCAQLWTLALHLSMFYKPLQQNEIVQMHNSIGRTEDRHTLHIAPMCNVPVNFVLRTVLDSTYSSDTIEAIGNYVSYIAMDNAELAIR